MKKIGTCALALLFSLTGCAHSCEFNRQTAPINGSSYAGVISQFFYKVCEENTAGLLGEPNCTLEELAQASSSGFVFEHDLQGTLIVTAGHSCEFDPSENEGINEALASVPGSTIQVRPVFWIRNTNNQLFQASMIKFDSSPGVDLCLLRVDGSLNIPAQKIRRSNIDLGKTVYSVGTPYSSTFKNAIPIFAGVYSGIDDDTGFIITTIPTGKGSSGSPIVDENGELIGVMVRAHPQFQSIGIAVSSEVLSQFIESEL